MKALQMNDVGKLSLADIDKPTPGPGQILIKVFAAGITRPELLWYPTTHTPSGEPRLHAVPGHEFSGVIAGLGEDVSGFTIGEPVYGMNDWFQDGAMAEYCLTTPWSIAAKPARLTHIEAATAPISALTAWQGLFEKAQLRAGERVLVQGGGGAVGLFVVQLAHLHGAHVIDYRAARFEEAAGQVDVVFDTVGGEIRERSRALLTQNGRMVSIVENVAGATDPTARGDFFIVEPNHEQLKKISGMLDDGRLRAFVKGVVPLENAALAYTGAGESNSGFGKLVVATVSVDLQPPAI